MLEVKKIVEIHGFHDISAITATGVTTAVTLIAVLLFFLPHIHARIGPPIYSPVRLAKMQKTLTPG